MLLERGEGERRKISPVEIKSIMFVPIKSDTYVSTATENFDNWCATTSESEDESVLFRR
jgi:hypothetical protein